MGRKEVIWLLLGLVVVVIFYFIQQPQLPSADPVDSSLAAPSDTANSSPEMSPVDLPDANPEAFRGLGSLAFTKDGLLYHLDGEKGETRLLSESGQAISPKWSHDGRWVAYVRVNDQETKTGSLWVVKQDGTQAHQLQGLPGSVGGDDFAWSPADNILAVRIAGEGLWLALVDEEPQPLVELDDYSWFAWSPDGQYIAYNVAAKSGEGEGNAAEGGDALVTVEVATGEITSLASFPGQGIEVAKWWPDGQEILFWLNPAFHSPSIRADGLQLCSLNLADGSVKELTWALAYNEWLSFAPENDLLLVNGIDRALYHEKQLAIANIQESSIHNIDNPSGHVSLDPAFSSDGSRIAFVTAAADEKLFYEKPEEWQQSRTLWVMKADGSDARQLTSAGQGVFQPRWSKDGSHILYWRDNSLWVIDVEGKNPQKVFGPFSTGNQETGFYGHMTFDCCFAWFQ